MLGWVAIDSIGCVEDSCCKHTNIRPLHVCDGVSIGRRPDDSNSEKVQRVQDIAVSEKFSLDEIFNLINKSLNVLCIPKLNYSTGFF